MKRYTLTGGVVKSRLSIHRSLEEAELLARAALHTDLTRAMHTRHDMTACMSETAGDFARLFDIGR